MLDLEGVVGENFNPEEIGSKKNSVRDYLVRKFRNMAYIALAGLGAGAVSLNCGGDVNGPENRAPTASFNVYDNGTELGDPFTAIEGSTLRFRSTSTDPDGRIVKQEWYIDGSLFGTGVEESLPFPDPGSYNIMLKVWDNGDKTDTETERGNITEKDRIPPYVTSTNLTNNFDVSSNLEVIVSEKLNSGTVNSSNVTLKKNGDNVNGAVTYNDANKKIILNPESNLDYLTEYILTIASGVTDIAGNSFDGNKDGTGGDNYTQTFRTVQAPDIIPPATITDLTATTGDALYQVILEWTAPGDDENLGMASEYDIRYLTTPITTGNWGSATQVQGEPLPSLAGTPEQMSIVLPTLAEIYYFGVKTKDEVPNISELSNIANAYSKGYMVTGNITDLLESGVVPVEGAIVTIGTKADTTDASGLYNLMVGTDSVAFVINAADFYERIRGLRAYGDTTIDENIIPTSFDMAPFDEMVRESGAIRRWKEQPMQFYFDIRGSRYHDAPGDSVSGTPPTLEQRAFMDSLVNIEAPVETYGFIDNPNFVEGTDPPRLVYNPDTGGWDVPDGYFLIRRNDDIPSAATVANWHNEDGSVRATLVEYSGNPSMKKGIVKQDFYEGLTNNKDITLLGPDETIFNNGSVLLYLSQYDKDLLKTAFSRLVGNRSPDTDPH